MTDRTPPLARLAQGETIVATTTGTSVAAGSSETARSLTLLEKLGLAIDLVEQLTDAGVPVSSTWATGGVELHLLDPDLAAAAAVELELTTRTLVPNGEEAFAVYQGRVRGTEVVVYGERFIVEAEVRTWRHTRKGLIRGVIERETEEWATIRLAETVNGYVNTWFTGDVLTVRRSFLTEVTEAAS